MLAHAVLLALAAFPLSHRPRQDDAAVHDQLRALRTDIEAAFNRVGASRKREDLDAVLAHVPQALRSPYWVGAGAALAGLVLGFGGARVLARRR